MKKYFAEFFGTFWLAFGGCGSAVLAMAYSELGIGFTGVALAFGLIVLAMTYAAGHAPGDHLNPVASVDLFIGDRSNGKGLLSYILPQITSAIAAVGVLYPIASDKTGLDAVVPGFAGNGFSEHSPSGCDMMAALLIEFILIVFFLTTIMDSTGKLVPAGFAPIAIDLDLTLTHSINILVANASVNPVCPTGVALFQGGWAVEQLWLLWLALIAGTAVGAAIYRFVLANNDDRQSEQSDISGATDTLNRPHPSCRDTNAPPDSDGALIFAMLQYFLFPHSQAVMQTLPFQTDIAARMLIDTENEAVHPDAVSVQIQNGYWIAWHDQQTALFAPDTPSDTPCLWVEGTESLEELVSMVEDGEFDEVEEFDGDDNA